MQIKETLRQWNLPLLIIVLGGFLFATGLIFNFFPSIQVVAKKTFLVAWWYFLTYIFRKLRLGTLKWEEDDKKIYYFILLIGSALIFALA
ncbi:MAG: hypothetical protein DRP34_04905 [Thermodesulfobacteriota bacterium]|nr:MAG: hypothetical protein DRP34_04905 [Thermodesulfobacteriota bacterium]